MRPGGAGFDLAAVLGGDAAIVGGEETVGSVSSGFERENVGTASSHIVAGALGVVSPSGSEVRDPVLPACGLSAVRLCSGSLDKGASTLVISGASFFLWPSSMAGSLAPSSSSSSEATVNAGGGSSEEPGFGRCEPSKKRGNQAGGRRQKRTTEATNTETPMRPILGGSQ